jgi:hypothetical protein
VTVLLRDICKEAQEIKSSVQDAHDDKYEHVLQEMLDFIMLKITRLFQNLELCNKELENERDNGRKLKVYMVTALI